MRLIIFSMFILMTACGPGGDSPTSTTGVLPPPSEDQPDVTSCKTLGSVWTSTSDLENHDLSSLPISLNTWTLYMFIGTNGANCSPGQTAKIYNAGIIASGAGFEYVMEFSNNNPGAGCNHWQDGSGPSSTHGSALVDFQCNKLILCHDVNRMTCKEFN